MTIEKNILKIVPGIQATALLGENLKLIKRTKFDKIRKYKYKKPVKQSFVKTAVKNFVGIGMIGATSKMVNDLN